MRGLTPFERWWLGDPNANDDQGEHVAELVDMRLAGRVGFKELEDCCHWPNTELGDLALRVCPVDEF